MNTTLKLKETNDCINEGIFGHFIEHAFTCIEGGIYDPGNKKSNEYGVRTDTLELIKELAPSSIRFPGGTVSCQYHFEDCIGPKEKRKKKKNLIWGGEIDPGFGTCEFVRLCKEVHAEPVICINMVSGTPEEAGNWVEYCNGDGDTYYANLRREHGFSEPFGVKYWCIGNESFAEPDMGVHHNVEKYITDAKEFIKRMKLTDDSVKIIIVGCDKREWNKAVLDNLQEMIDYISVHFYSSTQGRSIKEAYEDIRKFESEVNALTGLIETYPAVPLKFDRWYRFSPRRLPIKIAVDEWNIWNINDCDDYGLLCDYDWNAALWCAKMMIFFINSPSVGLANLAQLVNVMAPIKTDSEHAWFQPIALPLIWFRKLMKGNRVEVDIGKDISACAANNENGTVIALVNHHSEKVKVELEKEIKSMKVILNFNEYEEMPLSRQVTLPEESVVFLTL